jgi:putative ABC transport system substrate-binding protein
MKRREFIMLVGGALAPSTFAARAQQPTKLPIIGFLGPTAPAPGWIAAFLERLREHGWIDGKNLAIEYRWAEGRPERFAEFAADFIRLKVDVIFTGGTPVVLALKRATSEIPIVFSSAGDPVGTGLVESLARPGGNITGLSFMTADVAGKRLELLREIVPGLGRLALIANAGFPEALLEMREVQATATTLGVNTMPFEVRRQDDFPAAFEAIKGADALYVCGDPMMLGNRARISALALDARLPTVHSVREHVEAGGLISYGTDFQELFRRTADFVDKILRGTRPAEIPVEQPTKFDLVVNLVTAKTLGLAMPPTLLARADRIIE